MTLSGETLGALPTETRLLRYHEFREDALQKALQMSDGAERARLVEFAEGWRLLAEETERVLRQQR
jgi:hypothetical protein